MKYTRAQLQAGLANAGAAQDQDAVRYFNTQLAQIDQNTQAAASQQQAESMSNVYDMHYDQMGGGEKFMKGVSNGLNNVGGAVKDLYYRATGNDDGLSMLQGRMDTREAQFKELSDRSTAAAVGNFVGETLPAVPLGLGAGAVVAKAGMTGYRAAMAAGALEESVYRGVFEEGDFGERASNAAGGAVAGAAFGSVAEAGSRGLNKYLTRNKVPSIGPNAAQADVDKVQAFTEEFGGYKINAGDALVNDAQINDRLNIRAGGGEPREILLAADAEAERGIVNKAESFVAGSTDATTMSRETTQDNFVKTLRDVRGKDLEASSEAYKKWEGTSDAARTVQLESRLMNQGLKDVLGPSLNMSGAVGNTAKDIQNHLRAAGLLNVRPQSVMGLGTKEGITLVKYKKLEKALNTLYEPTTMSGAEKQLWGSVRASLESNIDEAVAKSGIGAEDLEIYRAGRKSMADYNSRWELKWAKRATDMTPASKEFLNNPKTVFDAILAPKNKDDLAEIKKRMLMDPEGKVAWESVGETLILNAIEASKKASTEGGGARFNENIFRTMIDKVSPEAQGIIFGPERAEGIQALIKAASLRGPKVKPKGSNNSDTADALIGYASAASRLYFTNKFAQIFAATRITSGLADGLAKRGLEGTARRMAAGELTGSAKAQYAKEFKEAWKKTYRDSPALLGHTDLASELFFQGAQEGLYDPLNEKLYED